MLEGPGADSEEKHEPASDVDTALVDRLKALDPNRPIREADICSAKRHVRFTPNSGHGSGIRINKKPLSFRPRVSRPHTKFIRPC